MSWKKVLKMVVSHGELDIMINELKLMIEDEIKDNHDYDTRHEWLQRETNEFIGRLKNMNDSSTSGHFMVVQGDSILDDVDSRLNRLCEGTDEETQALFDKIRKVILWRVENS